MERVRLAWGQVRAGDAAAEWEEAGWAEEVAWEDRWGLDRRVNACVRSAGIECRTSEDSHAARRLVRSAEPA
jgi:hypothetical protein